jgi:VanZ family protein
MKKILSSVWLSIIWTIAVFGLFAMPMSNVKEVGILDLFEIDKLVHLILFAVFTFLWGTYLCQKKFKNELRVLIVLTLVAAGYGLIMEFYQKFFTERNFSILDALADSLGAIIGTLITKESPYGNRGRNQN